MRETPAGGVSFTLFFTLSIFFAVCFYAFTERFPAIGTKILKFFYRCLSETDFVLRDNTGTCMKKESRRGNGTLPVPFHFRDCLYSPIIRFMLTDNGIRYQTLYTGIGLQGFSNSRRVSLPSRYFLIMRVVSPAHFTIYIPAGRSVICTVLGPSATCTVRSCVPFME